MIERVDFIGVPSRDAERSRAFYVETLGLRPDENARYEFWAGETCFAIWQPAQFGVEYQPQANSIVLLRVDENDVDLGHEATVSKIGEEQLFYLMSRGLSESESSAMIVSGFVEPITKELPLEYAVEMNRLIQLQMEGSVG